jgi:hypothetical protein
MCDHRAQVVEPKVRAYLYTWGDGRHTAEGEFIPVRAHLSPDSCHHAQHASSGLPMNTLWCTCVTTAYSAGCTCHSMCHAALDHDLQMRSTRLGLQMLATPHVVTTLTYIARLHSVSWPPLQVRSEELDLGNIDGLLLLPITIEHTIDERSPLCGLTHASLQV